ncbi:linear amide C-N hydrolase [Alishewanella longhuensis]
MRFKLKMLLAALVTTQLALPATACTRAVYKGPEQTIITARSMDWKDEIPADLWLFPRGITRQGEVGPNSISWTAKYGSIVASAFDIASADGMNEKGLVANLLWLVESRYPEYDGSQPGLTIAAWVQYMLDNFATVAEAVAAMQSEPFVIVSADIPGTSKFATLHLAISDATGDNAVFEYIDGKLVIHHSPDYTVMTNSPIFEKQLAINEYWRKICSTTALHQSIGAICVGKETEITIVAIALVGNTLPRIGCASSCLKSAGKKINFRSSNSSRLLAISAAANCALLCSVTLLFQHHPRLAIPKASAANGVGMYWVKCTTGFDINSSLHSNCSYHILCCCFRISERF